MGRYEIIDINRQILITENCPLQINKYVLCDDRLGDQLMVQLEFQNLGQKEIKDVHIELVSFSETSLICEHIYHNINLAAGANSGLSEAIYLSGNNTDSFRIRCKQILFADTGIWDNIAEKFYA